MKNPFLFIIACLFSLSITAQSIAPDLAFADSGRADVGLTGAQIEFFHTALLPDGKILCCGEVSPSGDDDFYICRFLSTGIPDPSFGIDGRVKFEFTAPFATAIDMLLLNEGKFIVTGIVRSAGGGMDFGMARFLENGQADSTFGTNGIAQADFRETGSFDSQTSYSIAKQSNGKIILGGTDVNDVGNIALVRFTADGIPDSTFGTASVVLSYVGGQFAIVGQPKIVIDDDDRIIWASTYSLSSLRSIYLARFVADGQKDLSFNGTGVQNVTMSVHSRFKDMFLTDNKLTVLATRENPNAFKNVLIKLNEDGTLDASYSDAGMFVFLAEPSRTETAYCMKQGPGNKITICGISYDNNSEDPRVYVSRVLENGTMDAGFATNGVYSFSRGAGSALFYDIEMNANRIVLAGSNITGGFRHGYVFALKEEGGNIGFETITDSKITVFPNPVQAGNSLTVQAPGTESVIIYDLQGRLVQQFACKSIDKLVQIPTDEKLNPGIYVLVIKGAGTLRTRKLFVE